RRHPARGDRQDEQGRRPRPDAVPDRTHRASRPSARRAPDRRLLRDAGAVQQLASIQVPEARQLLVRPHDRATLTAIERAIIDSDLGVSPSNDGVVIRLNFPALTEERRKEYVKVVKTMAEDAKVAVRN